MKGESHGREGKAMKRTVQEGRKEGRKETKET